MLFENLPLRFGWQGLAKLREDRHARTLQVDSIEHVANRLGTAARLLDNPAGALHSGL